MIWVLELYFVLLISSFPTISIKTQHDRIRSNDLHNPIQNLDSFRKRQPAKRRIVHGNRIRCESSFLFHYPSFLLVILYICFCQRKSAHSSLLNLSSTWSRSLIGISLRKGSKKTVSFISLHVIKFL